MNDELNRGKPAGPAHVPTDRMCLESLEDDMSRCRGTTVRAGAFPVSAWFLLLSLAALLGCTLAGSGAAPAERHEIRSGDDPPGAGGPAHGALLAENPYPSATECRTCHPDHYREWSVSQHAYAQISPVFNAMHGAVDLVNNGTFGDFCIRCHTPVGMALGEPIFAANRDRDPVALEGITCIVCHRVNKDYGKVSGHSYFEAGDIFSPIFGPRDDEELRRVLGNPDEFGRVATEPGQVGREIHTESIEFTSISKPGFCGKCHDVTFVNGFRLEEAFSEYKRSPAADRGETCQDCHMGTEPGVASGYATAPAARMGDAETAPRKRTNHMWVGPDHSVVHPGIFPHNPDAKELATPDEWATFDYEAGWGTDEFEDAVEDDEGFPERWLSIDDRYEAREIIDQQLELLAEARDQGTILLRNGYELGEIATTRADSRGIAFEVEVRNATDGHNVPTGFIAERMVFLQVTVKDAEGNVVFRSGDLDPNGDVRDLHSSYVHQGKLHLDEQLFSLQSKFLVRMIRGGEREQVLVFNYSADPLPFSRPAVAPTILSGRPLGARTHRKSIEPNGRRRAKYEIDAEELTGHGPYVANVKLVAGMIPPNLIAAISVVGFDYGMSPRAIGDAVVAGHRVLWERDVTLEAD